MHQPYRYSLVPGLEEITRLRAPGLLGCALSGAGPSILVFHERVRERLRTRTSRFPPAWARLKAGVLLSIFNRIFPQLTIYAHEPARPREGIPYLLRRTIRWTGTRGARKLWLERARKISPYSCRWVTRLATGVT